jgi:chemotaxis protein MotB
MANQDDSQRPIIIRRKKVVAGGHHGGAWKIAYADFVTAMMAFFLLMWLLGSTTKGELEGIAEYFKNPMKVSLAGGSGSGDSSSIIKGGGQDLTRRNSSTQRGDIVERKKTVNLKAAQAEIERLELQRLAQLKQNLEEMIQKTPQLHEYSRQLLIDITSEGLRVQIVDEKNRPMFELGRAEMLPHTRTILRDFAGILNEVPNRIRLAGHTDATAYLYGERGYSNWELSADRANASRRELIAGGLQEGKVVRVVGLASSVLFNNADPYDPINRRISVIVLNKRTEQFVLRDGINETLNVDGENPPTPDQLNGAESAPLPSLDSMMEAG